MSAIGIAVVGLGKIARDQHLPAIAANPQFKLLACVDPHPSTAAAPVYPDLKSLFKACPQVQAVAICTPPQVRHALAREALLAGCHVLLEKPPAASLPEVADLGQCAAGHSRTLFAAWHSRYARAIDPARHWIDARAALREVRVSWREDVRHWHPNQEWIWEPGGLGVFDPGINALSILTTLLPGRITLREANLFTPSNRKMPIAAQLWLSDANGVPIHMDLDFRQTGQQTWDIAFEAVDGSLRLTNGGERLLVNETELSLPTGSEYPRIYQRFAALIAERAIDADAEPLRLVNEALGGGRQSLVAAFH